MQNQLNTTSQFQRVTLTTQRLTLRWLTEADIPAVFALFSHPEVMRYWSSPPMTDISQAEKSVQSIQEGYQTGDFLQLGIERNEDKRLLGTCTLFAINHTCRRAELGYALDRPYWGAGYMNEALVAFLDYGFHTLDLNRVEADIDPRNTASAKTLERLGFQFEGLLHERWIVNGEVSDTGFYGLLRKEWRRK